MPDPASADFVGTGRFAFNNAAANRRELVNGGDLLKDRSVPPQKLSRDAFPPDIRPGPSGEKPSWHDEPDKDAHEKGTPPSLGDPQRYDRVARADHNHDFTYQRVGMTQVSGTAPAEYVAPFYDAGEGPHPAATPAEPHKRIANWSVYPDYADRIKGGAIEVWTETSVDAGVTWREPVLRAVVPPGSISAEYEVRDVDLDPATYVVEPQVRVYVKPVGHDQDPALKVVRAGADGKIDPDWLPAATTRKPLVYADGTKPAGNTVADTTSKTAFLSSCTIPANRLAVGCLVRIRARGFHSTTGTPTLLFELEIGGIVALASGRFSLGQVAVPVAVGVQGAEVVALELVHARTVVAAVGEVGVENLVASGHVELLPSPPSCQTPRGFARPGRGRMGPCNSSSRTIRWSPTRSGSCGTSTPIRPPFAASSTSW